MEKGNKKILYVLYLLGFAFSLHVAIPTFINSSFLSNYLQEDIVGALYTLGSLFSLIVLINATKILSRFGNYKTLLSLIVLEIIALLTLAFADSLLFIAPAFIIHLVAIVFAVLNIDLFLEFFSSDSNTGEIRGKILTSANFAWVISPVIAGFILTNGDYWKIYLTSAVIISFVFLLTLFKFKNFEDPIYDDVPFWGTLKIVRNDKSLYNIFISSLILRFFYAWMVIYTPIYLHSHLNFAWDQIGIILTIMLLPFIIFQFPLGRLADKLWGEKEILSIGFVIMSLATISLTFITSTSIVVWASVLFISRIGASAVEIMTESHFFKHIDATDAHVLSFFRNARNISYVIGPAVASVFLYFFEYKYLFLVLGLIVLIGLKYSLSLKDTK